MAAAPSSTAFSRVAAPQAFGPAHSQGQAGRRFGCGGYGKGVQFGFFPCDGADPEKPPPAAAVEQADGVAGTGPQDTDQVPNFLIRQC